jgi:hypothetical protein
MVSIIPGIEARAPERTETRSGFFGSPNFFPSFFSTRERCCATSF